jgi:hypothetical protein
MPNPNFKIGNMIELSPTTEKCLVGGHEPSAALILVYRPFDSAQDARSQDRQLI